jgi:hypothetical protein
VTDLDDRLDDLRRLAGVVSILDRDAALRIHAVIGALESLILRLDAPEVAHGLAAVEHRGERRLCNA